MLTPPKIGDVYRMTDLPEGESSDYLVKRFVQVGQVREYELELVGMTTRNGHAGSRKLGDRIQVERRWFDLRARRL